MVDRKKISGHRSYPTVTLLLLAVNGPLVVLVSLLLVTDYRREMGRAIDARRITLSDEAGLIRTMGMRSNLSWKAVVPQPLVPALPVTGSMSAGTVANSTPTLGRNTAAIC